MTRQWTGGNRALTRRWRGKVGVGQCAPTISLQSVHAQVGARTHLPVFHEIADATLPVPRPRRRVRHDGGHEHGDRAVSTCADETGSAA